MTAEQRQRLRQAVDQHRREQLFTVDINGANVLRSQYRIKPGTGQVVNGVEHGRHYAYTHGKCRCDVCTDAATGRNRAYRKRRAAA